MHAAAQVAGQVDIDLTLKQAARCIVLHAALDVVAVTFDGTAGALPAPPPRASPGCCSQAPRTPPCTRSPGIGRSVGP